MRERGGGEVPGGISAAAVSRSILPFRQSERVVQETSQLFRAVRAESCFNGGAAAVGPSPRELVPSLDLTGWAREGG